VSLAPEGPLTIDVGEVMRLAARRGLLSDQVPFEEGVRVRRVRSGENQMLP
jgi:hypothetical protein